MSIQYLGNHAIPPEVTIAASNKGLGQAKAVHQVPHRVGTEEEAAKEKGAERRQAVLVFAAIASPLTIGLLLWWATGSPGLGIGVGVVLTLVAWGASTYFMDRDDNQGNEDRERVYVFSEGFALPPQDRAPARAFSWDEVEALHRFATDNYVAGRLVITVHVYKLVLAGGELVVFRGTEQPDKVSPTDVLQLGPLLQKEIFDRRLPPAVEAINAGRTVTFGALALSTSGITTPAGLAPWNTVRELSTSAGHVVITAAGGKPGTYEMGEIPNFEVFWTLAQNLHAQH
ncbi:DUF6585 family protein [Lentzea sp. BCCO 10_0798]|uniref:DUF6585 family protein n=1 Tax=Lentzea kristufekii TaxID=3095430 RepID=A0ABU4TR87_9PSEU|nr:DUF6585 family protein [Lentzea sp. BCCO 10_0798]MDX8050810.1 DUF6585 family protein [Lentzea sp. BCCO 10_0798]